MRSEYEIREEITRLSGRSDNPVIAGNISALQWVLEEGDDEWR